jgi:hypothetical protein
MSADNEKHLPLLTEIIKKQITILGPDIALMKARSIGAIKVDDDGTVTSIEGDPKVAVEGLIEEYVKLSGDIVKMTLSSVFTKYPELGS